MYINEKNAESVVEALVEQIRALKSELWWKESKITELKSEIEKLKGGGSQWLIDTNRTI
jgi:peptidoglycan hydrolase CwlO-like protein